ncbi:hypothetical protein QR680_013999 [Steinernema hermaphroditum]|uniref:mitogen-activated protein kinase kinase kinase n=1 Tax=Steinernema hermaphroditum TaxID=289476 RepID=A0AA39IA50_9BILA|nr:hypothetical protein QR680_013999 [Steinernema hermaphroditum]
MAEQQPQPPGFTVTTDSTGNIVCPITCSPPLIHRQAPGGPGTRPAMQNARKLQVVMVIDGKVQKYLKAREMACTDVQRVADSLNINLTRIDFDRLDFGETNTLDTFYNADVVIVDVTITHQQPSLCYHIGVRESMGQTYNMVITFWTEDSTELHIMEALRKTLAHLPLIVYLLPHESGPLMSVDKVSKIDNVAARVRTETDHIIDKMPPHLRNNGMLVKFRTRLKNALENVQVEASKHQRDKFMSDLRKARELVSVDEANAFLDKMRIRLDNPDVLSIETVHQYLLSYRDNQNYDAMINLIDDLSKIDMCRQIVEFSAISFLYSFALNRRNKEGDRDRALKNVLQIIEQNGDNTISPDVICLAGRIYKDKFIGSNYEDRESLDRAIEWYRRAFELSPLEYSGINLTTLLKVRGEQFEHNGEMQQIAIVLNSLLGRKGALQNLTDYWDVATFFEVSVLAEDYNKACQAAQKMVMLKPPNWFLKSTMENIKLINRCAATLSPIEKEKQTFLFWSEFFMEATDGGSSIACARFPVLIQEVTKQFTPSYLTLNYNEGSLILSHVLENSQQKKPPPGIHRWHFTASNIKAVSASKRDDRSMFLYVHENSDDFNLIFPTAPHCNKVMESLIEMMNELEGDSGKVLHDCEQENQIEYEYELNNNRDRVVLGRGTYGTVYSARDLTTQRSIVVKEVEVKNEEEVQPLMEEIQLHSTLSHQNIVQYLGSKLLKQETGNDIFLIFMEQVPGGSLSSLLRSKWGPLDNEQTMSIYGRQILEGLKYLHEQKIVHRDIKGDNVLVNTYSGVCKISDFGTCKRLAGLNPVTETFAGTLQYMAPEVIDHGQRGYGAPADIWSFGCTMIEMATGRPPFVELGSPQAAMFKVGMFKAHPPIPPLSERASRFIRSCFEPDPVKRPTAAQLLQDIFIQQYVHHSNRSGSMNKKHIDGGKHNREIQRSSSHMSGMGLSTMNAAAKETNTVKETSLSQTQVSSGKKTRRSNRQRTGEKLHLLISQAPDTNTGDNLSNRSISPCTFHLSQPSSPQVAEENHVHTPLTASPSLGVSLSHSGMSSSSIQSFATFQSTSGSGPAPLGLGLGSLNRTTSDDSSMSNRFFTLKKDSERRTTLSSFMSEYRSQIVEAWHKRMQTELPPCQEIAVTTEMLETLLFGMRDFIHSKEPRGLQNAIESLKAQLDYDPSALSQLNNALYIFSDAIQPTLRLQSIKPHWMFALDNLIRSAVQTALSFLSPDLLALLSVQDSKRSRDLAGSHSEHSTVDSRPNSAPPPDLDGSGSLQCLNGVRGSIGGGSDGAINSESRKQLKSLTEQNKRLFEELLSVEREFKELLQATLMDKRMRLERLTEFIASSDTANICHLLPSMSDEAGSSGFLPISPSQMDGTVKLLNTKSSPSTASDQGFVNGGDAELIEWLKSLDVDDVSICKMTEEQYTKKDMLDFVTREEILGLGVKGGIACRIWRHILHYRQSRSNLRKGLESASSTVESEYFSPMGFSSHESLADL